MSTTEIELCKNKMLMKFFMFFLFFFDNMRVNAMYLYDDFEDVVIVSCFVSKTMRKKNHHFIHVLQTFRGLHQSMEMKRWYDQMS